MDTEILSSLFLILPVLFAASSAAAGSENAPNRLINEKSPYLLQHASNPVDWYPWGKEAFQKAREEDKPVLLSVGYSTCHWCHVMEEESFSDPETAALMNRHFVSIKVDREERPDIDAIYMSYVMAVTGRGGWPMTVFLTPDQKPFYGGTYYPPESRFGMPGFRPLLKSIADSWKNRRDEILKSADSAVDFLNKQGLSSEPAELTEATLGEAFEQLAGRFDPVWGGFGAAPKFPMGHSLSFLLRYWRRTGQEKALTMTEDTLRKMARGGVYDQLGGGFHRYSTDREWFLPHFEKMLYDQALLARAYAEAFQATGKPIYADVAKGILDYVLREMTSPEGAFYSAQDADSPEPGHPDRKREGAFFVWKWEELEKALGPEDLPVFAYVYGAEPGGNVREDPQGEFTEQNVLFRARTAEEAAAHFQKTTREIKTVLERSRSALFEIRSKRPRPHLDDKVLTDWNGLMISSLSFASRALGEERYSRAAVRAAEFILKKLKDPTGNLRHRYRGGDAGIAANLDDYAFFLQACLELYQATADARWLAEAKSLAERMTASFWDEKNKGFFMTSDAAGGLVTRPKQDYDGAIPSGNSAASLSMTLLNRFTADPRYRKYADETLESYSASIASGPAGYTLALQALDYILGPSYEIVVAADENGSNVEAFMKEINSRFIPNKIVLVKPLGGAGRALAETAPFTKDLEPLAGKTAVYICRDHACELPVNSLAELQRILNNQAKKE